MNTLKQIPYVDGVPQFEGQESITWIQNGEQLIGANSESSNEGNLNLSGVQIQKNIKTLIENDFALLSVVDNNATDIENIKSLLNESVDLSIFEQLNQNKESINVLKTDVEGLTSTSEQTKLIVENIVSQIGVKSDISGDKKIFEDLDFIKQRLGNYKDEDINGNVVDYAEDTGIIKKLNDSLKQTVSNTNEISAIKEKMIQIGLEELDSDVDVLKSNVGVKPISFNKTIYEQLEINSNEISNHDEKINKLIVSVGENNISQQVNELETSYLEQSEEINSLQTSSNEIKLSVENNEVKLLSNEKNISNLIDVVGESDEFGIQKNVKLIQESIGDDLAQDTVSIKGRLNNIESKQTTNSAKLQEIEIQIGDSNSGLIKNVFENTRSINGNSQSANVVEKSGLMKTTKELYESNSLIINSINSIVSKQNYNSKKFSFVSGNNIINPLSNIDAVISSKLNATKDKTIFVNGIENILLNNTFSDVLKSDVILFDVGSYESSEESVLLGTIADATDSYEGDGSFYNSLFKLLRAASTSTSNPRIFVSNGISTSDEYSEAIKSVTKMFCVPFFNTSNELGINEWNISAFVDENVLNTLGATRFINYVSGSINSK